MEKLVGEMPLKQIGIRYNVSGRNTVAKKCRKFGIPIPEKGQLDKSLLDKSQIIG